MVEVSLTVGKLDASLALLLTNDHHLIEFPTILLPNGITSGSIVKLTCEQDVEKEKKEEQEFRQIQEDIMTLFAKNLPEPPVLKIRNVTQTSCVLEWEDLKLGTASLKNLILLKDGKKLGVIPQPLVNKTTKLSGLPIDKTFNFQLRLDTTAGVYQSDVIEVTTHKMTDLSGITVCLGDISASEKITLEDIEATLKNMGAHYPIQREVKVDTTHFICTRENKQNPEYLKAYDMNIPIIRPEWLKACERERRIVGVRNFYVKDCVLPDIYAQNYWGHPKEKTSDNSSNISRSEGEPTNGIIGKEHEELVAPEPSLQYEATSNGDENAQTKNVGESENLEEEGTEDSSNANEKGQWEPANSSNSKPEGVTLENEKGEDTKNDRGPSEVKPTSENTTGSVGHEGTDTEGLHTENNQPPVTQVSLSIADQKEQDKSEPKEPETVNQQEKGDNSNALEAGDVLKKQENSESLGNNTSDVLNQPITDSSKNENLEETDAKDKPADIESSLKEGTPEEAASVGNEPTSDGPPTKGSNAESKEVIGESSIDRTSKEESPLIENTEGFKISTQEGTKEGAKEISREGTKDGGNIGIDKENKSNKKKNNKKKKAKK